MDIGPSEIIIIVLVVLLLFGSSRLPKLARSVGEASREFKKGMVDGSQNAAGPDAADQHATGKGREVPSVADPDREVTMTQAELETLLATREAQVREAQVREAQVREARVREARGRQEDPPQAR